MHCKPCNLTMQYNLLHNTATNVAKMRSFHDQSHPKPKHDNMCCYFLYFVKKFEKLVATFNWLHPAVDLKRVEEIERGEEIETEGVPQPNKAKAQLEGG